MSTQGPKFLVVDDSMVARRMLVSQLRELGFAQIEEADNGEAGLKKLMDSFGNNAPITVVITDLQMPVMTGTEMMHKIRENPEFNDVALLITSVETDKGTVLAAVTKGADGYILKPSSTAVLKDKLTRILAKNNIAS
jgi:two-component system chemotaxis response regulator CheY